MEGESPDGAPWKRLLEQSRKLRLDSRELRRTSRAIQRRLHALLTARIHRRLAAYINHGDRHPRAHSSRRNPASSR